MKVNNIKLNTLFNRIFIDKVVFYLLSLFLFLSVSYYLSLLNKLSLWGDELWTLSRMSIEYSNLIKPGFLNDASYPLPIAFYKLSAYILGSGDVSIIVLTNFVNFLFIFLGFLVVRKYFSIEKITFLLSLIVSTEYFMRMFLELRHYGMILGLCTLISCFFLRFNLEKEKSIFLLCIFIGLILSLVHPYAGLFVCSIFATMFFLTNSIYQKATLIVGISFSVLFFLFYASRSTEGLFIELTFNHVRNTFAFMIPALFLFTVVFYFEFKRKFKGLHKILSMIMPVLISLGVIYTYSFLIHPIYQARYFTVFLPLTCLVLVYICAKDFDKVKYPILISCILTVIFLYGPRSQVPYTNYQALVEESHNEECDGAPIFFNNSRTLKRRNFYEETFNMASRYYSESYRRELKAYDEVLDSIEVLKKNFPECNIYGATGQGEQEVFAVSINNELYKRNLNNRLIAKETRVSNCIKPGCGILFSFSQKKKEVLQKNLLH